MSGITRRQALKTLQSGSLLLVLGSSQIAWGASIVAVRIWPSEDYTRITIESDGKLHIDQQFMLDNPYRLVVDINSIGLDPKLQDLVNKIETNDPQITSVRVGQQDGGKLRLVFDLKQNVRPQIFSLKPIAAYKDRLVLDLYPTAKKDPLEDLISGYVQDASKGDAAAPNTSENSDPLGDLIAQKDGKKTNVKSTKSSKQVAEQVAKNTRKQKKEDKRTAAKNTKTTKPRTASKRKPKDKQLIIVAIDPGHGGEDPGAIGPSGTKEKDVVLQISKRLEKEINKMKVGNSPMRAYLTRDKDFYVPLRKRVQKATKVQADLFVSIHADAFRKPSASGASVFVLSQKGASSEEARWMAKKENTADLIGGTPIATKDKQVNSAIFDMSTTVQIRESLSFGSRVLKEIGRFAKLHKKRTEQAGFAVLKSPTIPSILVETAFISNPEEEKKLRDPNYQAKLAKAIAKGIQRYFAKAKR